MMCQCGHRVSVHKFGKCFTLNVPADRPCRCPGIAVYTEAKS